MHKILVVEGNEEERRRLILETDWASMDCLVTGEAGTGAGALSEAEARCPDRILTDLALPDIPCARLAEELRLAGCAAPFLVMGDRADFESVREALRFGASDYLLKPVKETELSEALTRLEGRKAPLLSPECLPALPLESADRYVCDTVRFLTAHYGEEGITIRTVASHLGVSESHLSHVFKQETGLTVIGYLTRYRISTAMRLLGDGRRKVYEVARMVGYRDETYFASVFKKLAGLTPSEWRERVHS